MPEINIQEYLYQVWKRRNMVLIFAGSVIFLTLLFTLKQVKIYRAETIIEIGAETPDALFVQDVVSSSTYNGWWTAMRYYETQYQIITSRDLLTRVAQKAIEKNMFPGWKVDQITGFLQGGVSVKGSESSRLATIYFEDSDPARAQAMSILVSEVYVDENLGRKLRGIDDAVTWLNARLTEVRAEKVKREDELQKKKQEYKVVSFSDNENTAKANLRALTDDLNRLKSVRIEVQAKYLKLKDLVEKSERVEDLFGVVTSDLLTKIKEDLAELKTQKSKLSQKYLEKHPEIVKIDAQIIELNQQIKQEVKNEVSRLQTRYLLSKAEEDAVARALDQQKVEAIKLEQVNREIADTQLITNTNQQVFETLLKKIKEADLSSLVKSNNIRVVDRALLPSSPVQPNVQKNILLGIIVGIIGGIGLALIMEYLDDTVKSHEDIERYLGYSVLAVIPHFSTEAEKNGLPEENIDNELAFLPHKQPTSVVSEFYRTLRTNILFLTKSKPGNKILFASTGPAEGKTATALNTSVTLAQIGKRTIIVDMDFRRPKLHRIFNHANFKGVTNFLLGEITLEEGIQKSQVENLDYMLAGSIPPNPSELLSLVELKDMLDTLSKRYDYVIIDSSPIAPVTDAAILSQNATGVILLVRSGKTHRKAVLFSNEQLKKIHANVLGVVLNDVQIHESSYSSYQYYRYGYTPYGDKQA